MNKDNNGTVSRGFVTMATGRDEYYVLARNLLLSYRYFTSSPMPFAIVCDRENEITALFDEVVLMENPKFSVFDKLRLPELVPYDEAIFIEPDCLAYRDLNGLWKEFGEAPDFGVFGTEIPLDARNGWIDPEYLGQYRSLIDHQMFLQGGISFLRRNNLAGFSHTCDDIFGHFEDFHFRLKNEEAVLALACLLHGYKPVKEWQEVFCYYPVLKITAIDIRRGVLRFISERYGFNSPPGIYLVHWGTKHTRGDLYKREAEAILSLTAKNKHASPLIPVRIALGTTLLHVRRSLKSIVPVPVKAIIKRLLGT